MITSRCVGSSGSVSGEAVSENKKGGSDPFEGLDWDSELDAWDKSTAEPGGASVPESFSQPPPPVAPPASAAPPKEDLRASQAGSSKTSRPLYRPPSASFRASAARPPAQPPPPRVQTAPPPSARPLPSLMDDDDSSMANTRGGNEPAPLKPIGGDDDDENRTVVAEVSQDLLDQLEAAGIRRPQKPAPAAGNKAKPAPAPPPAPIPILDEQPDEQTSEHPAPEPEDPSVVTSAPEVVRSLRAKHSEVEKSIPPEAPVRDGKFDPFHGMDLEPPVSETVGRRAGEGPQLLAPEERRHSPEDETAILDKRALFAGQPAKYKGKDADATEETADPFASVQDPFASPDPFGGGDAPEVGEAEPVREDDQELIDLLRGDDQSSDALPAVQYQDDERPAVAYVGEHAEAWRGRAERVAADARLLEKSARARGLIVASEIAAIAGDYTRAIELAEEAWQAAPGEAIAVRQLRQLLAREGRWEEVAPLLEAESKSGSNGTTKAHAALMAAEVARLARSAPDEAAKLYEASQRMSSNDVRPMVARAVTAMVAGKQIPLLKWPQGSGAEPLGEAISRRAKQGEPVEDTQLGTVLEGISRFGDGDSVEASLAQALDELARSETLGPAATWTRIALDAARPKGRVAALERIEGSFQGRAADEARLSLALDLGDLSRARSAASSLATARDLRTAVVESTVRALAGELPQAESLTSYAPIPGVSTVGRGLALAENRDAPSAFASEDGLDAAARVARRLSVSGHVEEELRARMTRGAQLGFLLGDAFGGGGPRATAEIVCGLLPTDGAEDPIIRMLAELAENDLVAATDAARQAVAVEPTGLPGILALLAAQAPDAEAAAIAAAQSADDDGRFAALAVRVALAALRRGDLDTVKQAADVAFTAQPSDPVAPFLAELRARRAGDFEGVLEAVRARAQAAADPVAKATHLVREILLLLGADPTTASERAEEATKLVPRDLGMRALYERLAADAAQGRAEFRAELAATLEGTGKAEALLDAAREAERQGDLESAEKYAQASENAGGGAEAASLRHRVQSRGDGAARLAEELLDASKKAEDTAVRREMYETLADLDLFARGDATSAIMWHQAILEETPDHLPSLRRLEHMLVSEGREDDYEMVATQLTRVLPKDSRDAHAEVAARLRLRRPGTPWDSIADLVAYAVERENPSLWATRLLDALARTRGDDASLARALDLSLARADRPHEIAALATRAAETAFRLGEIERARGYLERALDADPQHPTALASVAELRRQQHDYRGAAEAIEAMAQTQLVAEHRLEDWHAAAALWLDRVGDGVRGRAALERAAEIDLGYGDVFERLVELARGTRENEVVADLYQRRLAQITEPEPRAGLLVAHARVLVELGDRDAARASLAAALEAVPTHREALADGLVLSEQAEDWPEYEQYLIKLSKAEQEHPAAYMNALRRLGALYEGPLPNASRAEAVYRKILETDETDDEIRARLVRVYVSLGDADMAIETHQERVRGANDPVTRRTRLIELAHLLDEQANDPDRALKALEQARSSDLSDLVALSALAEFHTKHGRPEAVAAALDQAIEELRRRAADDPGDLALLEQLVKIFELRGREQSVRATRAVIAGLRGETTDMVGAEDAASIPDVDPFLCPPEITDALRAFLAKTGDAIEKSIPVDLRALKAAKLGTTNPVLKAKIDAVARGFGLPDPDVVISRAMPLLCLPVGAKPFQIVIGDGLVATPDDTARRFALARAMKVCGAHCSALIRVPPADLKVYLDALLHALSPAHPAPDMEAERLEVITKRLQRFLPRKEEAELKRLAEEVDAAGAIDVEALSSAAATWGDRVALLAIGDLAAALRGVAWSLGQKDAPEDLEAKRAWLRENPAARDLVSFALSDAYVEARKRCGVER
jgi:tetratricopeptide (TPR) repeat protein